MCWVGLAGLFCSAASEHGGTGVTSYSLIPSFFQRRAAGNLSDFPRARIHTYPATVLPWLRLNSVLEYWRKDEGGWTEVPFGIVGWIAGDPESHCTYICCVFAKSDSRSLRVRQWEAKARGWGLAKESDGYRGGHFTQRSFQEVSHQDAKGKLHLFHSRPNRATRRGGPSRRQYPLTNAIWDDCPGPCSEASHPKTSHFNLHFKNAWAIGYSVIYCHV